MLGRLNRVMMLMAIVLSIASPALAHTPPPSIASELDLRNVNTIDQSEITEPLLIIPASTFDDVARIEVTQPSIVERLEQRTDAMLAHADARTHRLFASDSAELASWPLASGDENNINGERKLSLELHRATEFQALPFSEPATGLVYARARWYDPATGSFLTPDPLGYGDSSNLYAFAGGDPVNRRDPTGDDAYDDKMQAYIAWHSDQYEALWETRKQLSSQLSGADPSQAIAEDRIAATRMMTFGGNADSAALFFEYARAGGNRAVLKMSNEQIHAELLKDEGVRAIGAAIVGGFAPGLAQLKTNLASGWKAFSEAAGDLVDFRWGSRTSNQRGSVTIRRGPGSFVPKKESMRPTAAQYQDDVGEGLPGQVYRVPYANPNPRGKPYVDYDGLQGTFPVDAKLAVVTRPKTVSQATRQAASLRQSNSKGIWKAPNMSEALRARKVIREANATDVLFVVVERKP